MKQEYLAVIDLPHFEPKRHPRMSRENRAAQFSPFAALTGFEAELDEAARQTETENEVGEFDAQEMDRTLRELAEKPREATFTMFVPDAKKEGGSYRMVRGMVKRVDPVTQTVTLEGGTVLRMEHIRNIQ